MSIVDTAKELLKKGIALGDAELIEMANQLLGAGPEESISPSVTSDKTKKVVKKTTAKKSLKKPLDTTKDSGILDREEFAVSNKEEFSTAKKRVHTNGPVKWVENTWEDTGESGDIDKKDLKTPRIKPAVRRPKYTKVAHKCGKCMKSVKVYPHDKTEFYRCEECLNSMVGR